MTSSDAGRKGGSAVRDKYGEDYYRMIGKKGGTRLKEKRGSEYYRDIARKGGTANMAKYGAVILRAALLLEPRAALFSDDAIVVFAVLVADHASPFAARIR